MTLRFVAIVIVLLFAAPALAQTTWHVDDDNCPGPGDGSVGNPFCSIQFAVIVAAIGDEVVVQPGTYNESIDFFSKGITLRSTDPNDPAVVMSTIIDGTGFFHVIQCVSGEGPDTVISGFIITGGNANGVFPDSVGGGMLIDESSPTVINCSFIGNTAGSGGGLYSQVGNPTVTNCSFIGNIATFAGGGMYNANNSPSVIHCLFCGNTADNFGGGMVNAGSTTTVSDCSFIGNTADLEDGGGMWNGGSNPTVINTGYCGNTPEAIFGEYTDGGGNSLTYCPPPTPLPDPCPGDTNGDGVVNVTDLLNLLGAWGVCPG